MEAVILIGIQASGKSTFYKQRFFDTHVRISCDLVRTRSREARLLQLCLDTRQPFAIDNTNPLADERAKYIVPAREAGFRVVGYFFRTEPRAAIARNNLREGRARIPIPGLLGTYKKLQEPRASEGFHELHLVTLAPDGGFVVQPFLPADAPGDGSA
ncbi:MAG TPA: AAA family ATPase [Longimicrobium sp.]|jgi:hypothetical protein|uniref:AAA family ATPase n=1 Tax=Longimicrobium sp. TaxID=2029185 RepID=UPI002ED7C885